MKKIIRLTESELIKLVKKVIKEGEGHEEKMKHFVDLGFDNMQAYFLCQLDDNFGWADLFNQFGTTVTHDLFNNDPNIFMKFIMYSLEQKDIAVQSATHLGLAALIQKQLRGGVVKPDKTFEYYPILDHNSYEEIGVMFLYFFNGDEKLYNEYLVKNFLSNKNLFNEFIEYDGDLSWFYV